MTPHDDDRETLTPEEVAELGTLLTAERPRPSAAFAAQLDARVAERFAAPAPTPAAPRRGRTRRWPAILHRPFLPAAAASLAVALVALVVALDVGGGGTPSTSSDGAVSAPAIGGSAPGSALGKTAPDVAAGDLAAPEQSATERSASADQDATAPAPAAGTDPAAARKVERSASLELGAPADRVDDVAQDALAVVARFDGIVDQSSVSSGTAGGTAQLALRIPAAKLQPALGALSQLPDARVLARTDDSVDVNQAYVSTRRRLANAQAERAGVVRALRAADTEEETLRLRARLDALERTIAQAEQAQRALDRRVDYSRVSVAIRADDGSAGSTGGTGTDGPFTVGSAFHDALRVLEVAAGVLVIAAAALLPLALLLACGWPLARALGRRRREQALDAAV